MRVFLVKIAGLSIIFLGIIGGVNYYIDSAYIFSTDEHLKKITDILKKGKRVTQIMNYDERNLKKILIKEYWQSTDEIIIGSSRSLLISDSTKKLINLSVSGATIFDYYAFTHLVFSEQWDVKKVIFDINPWLFNNSNELKKWKSLSKEYVDMYESISNKRENKYFELNYSVKKMAQNIFSFTYFKNNVTSNRLNPLGTINKYNDSKTLLFDGSITYGFIQREIKVNEVRERANRYIRMNKIYGVDNFNNFSEDLVYKFELLISCLRSKGIKVKFFMSPYHPIVYSFFKNNTSYANVIRTEHYIREFAKDNNIEVCGSLDPDRCGIPESYFMDGMHLNRMGVGRILLNN